MKKINRLLLGVLVFSLPLAAESFLLKKKKRISDSTLRESIGQQYADIARIIPDIHIQEALLDKHCKQMIADLLEQNKKSCIMTETNAQLQKHDERLAKALEMQERHLKELKAFNEGFI